MERQSIAWPVSQDPREASRRHSHHQQTVVCQVIRKEEREELLVAAQDQAINTGNYQEVIRGEKVDSKCRMCSQHEETVVSGCEVLGTFRFYDEDENEYEF